MLRFRFITRYAIMLLPLFHAIIFADAADTPPPMLLRYATLRCHAITIRHAADAY